MAEPEATLAAIYAHCSMPFTADAAEATLGYLDGRPRNKHGTHEYRLDQFGLTPEAINALFADYTARFGALL